MIGLNEIALDKVKLVGLNDVELASLNTMATVVGGACGGIGGGTKGNILMTLLDCDYDPQYENGGYAVGDHYDVLQFVCTEDDVLSVMEHLEIELKDTLKRTFKMNYVNYQSINAQYLDKSPSKELENSSGQTVIVYRKPTNAELPKNRLIMIGDKTYSVDENTFVSFLRLVDPYTHDSATSETVYNFGRDKVTVPSPSCKDSTQVLVNGVDCGRFADVKFEDVYTYYDDEYKLFWFTLTPSERESVLGGSEIKKYINYTLFVIKMMESSCGGSHMYAVSEFDENISRNIESEEFRIPKTNRIPKTPNKTRHVKLGNLEFDIDEKLFVCLHEQLNPSTYENESYIDYDFNGTPIHITPSSGYINVLDENYELICKYDEIEYEPCVIIRPRGSYNEGTSVLTTIEVNEFETIASDSEKTITKVINDEEWILKYVDGGSSMYYINVKNTETGDSENHDFKFTTPISGFDIDEQLDEND